MAHRLVVESARYMWLPRKYRGEKKGAKQLRLQPDIRCKLKRSSLVYYFSSI